MKEKWSEILGWMLTLCKFKLKGLSIFFFNNGTHMELVKCC